MCREQFLSEKVRDNHLTKPKRLFNKLKQEEELLMLLFSWYEEKNVLAQEVNRKKIGDCIISPKRFWMSCKEISQPHWWFGGIVSSEDDLMTASVFPQGARVNAVVYADVLRLWIHSITRRKPYGFQQDAVLSYTAHKKWIDKNFPEHDILNLLAE